MDQIGRGIANSPNYNEATKEQLFQSLFENPDKAVSSVETLRVLLDWILMEESPLLVRMGHRYFRQLSYKHPARFFDLVGPKFAVDLYLNNNYVNKPQILSLSLSLLDVLSSLHEVQVLQHQDETERAITNIIKCRIPTFLKQNARSVPVLAAAFELLSAHQVLIPRGQAELSKLLSGIVEAMAGFKYAPESLQEFQKIGKLFQLLVSLAGDKMSEVMDEILKTLYIIVYSSDVYDQPSACLMLIFDKIPSSVLCRATEYFVNDSQNPQGEARVVVALQTMMNWLSVVGNPSISHWVSVLLEALKDAGRYHVLVQLTHSCIEKLCSSLMDPLLAPSTEKIFFFLFMGFQHSEIIFHRLVAPLQQVLERVTGIQSLQALQESLIEAILYFARLFPNYPGLYEPLLDIIKTQASNKYLDDERLYELKKLSWIDKVEGIDGASATVRVSMLGLLNLGNTCYMNSILQALFLTKQFTDAILRSPVTASQIVLHRLQMVFAFLRLSMRPYYSPGDFLKVGRPPWFEPGRQQDCSEFMRYLLDTLHETEKHCRKNMSSSAFVDKFGRDMSENLRSYSTSALNSIEENDQEPESATQEIENPPSFDIGGSISNFVVPKTESDINMGSSNSLQSSLNDMRRWTTQENLSLTEEEELLTEEEENDSGIQSVVDSISGSSDSMQQCSEEFLSNVQKTFGGVLQNSYTCKACKSISRSKENFTDINLALPCSVSAPVSVQSLLEDFLKPEDLVGENKYHCESCRGLQDAEKSPEILESPSHLTCTLLRFHFDREAKRRSKIFTEISYERTLQLPSKGGAQTYDLYCIVFHSGYGSDSGHYYCFGRKTEEDSAWYNFNDSHVSLVNFDSFQERSSRFPRDTPYVLMYQRRPEGGSQGSEKPLRPDLRAAVEKDNRAYLMDLDKNMIKNSASSALRNFHPPRDQDDDDDNHGIEPSRSCHAGGKFDSFGGGRFIF